MNDTWRRAPTLWKWIVATFFVVMVIGATVAAIRGAVKPAVAAGGAALVYAWTFGLIEALRVRTTERLSRSQTIAAGLGPLAGFWLWRFVVTDDTLVFMGVGVVGMLLWLVLTVRAEGWSKRSS
jgi:hypothetical protein